MGMSTHVVGFRPADEQWTKMLGIWNACESGGIRIPKEVRDFFDDTDPNGRPGLEVEIKGAVTPYSANMVDGYDIDITKLPKDVSIVRVYNSY